MILTISPHVCAGVGQNQRVASLIGGEIGIGRWYQRLKVLTELSPVLRFSTGITWAINSSVSGDRFL